MRRLRGLSIKLLLVIIGGMVALAILFTLQMTYVLIQVRDQALSNATAGLESESRSQLPLLHEQMVARIQDRLYTIADANLIVARALIAAENQPLINPDYTRVISLTELPTGGLGDLRPGRITSIYVPPNTPLDSIQADLQTSALLDTLLPQQLLTKRQGILASLYIGPSGLLRTYPAVDVRQADFSSEQALLARFQDQSETPTWLPPFPPPNFIATVDERITAVVLPIYDAQEFRGLLISYVSLGSLTADLIGIQPTQDSWVFIVSRDRELIASAERFMPLLIDPSDPQQIITSTASTDLDRIIEHMALGERDLEKITLMERPYLITYAPITENNWSLALAVPLDDLTQSAQTLSSAIRDTSRTTLLIALLTLVGLVGLMIVVGIYFTRRLTRPLSELANAAHSIAEGDYSHSVPVRSQDEIGEVATAFNTMSQSILAAREQLQNANRELEATVQARTAELEQTIAQLQSTMELQGELDRQLRSVSTPVIPVAPGVLLMPLIGALNSERATEAVENLLHHVEISHAREVILDVTGITGVDATTAQTLLHTATALYLMGAETILTGIRPEVAELVVSLDADLGRIQPMSSLQAAIRLAFERSLRRTQRR